VGVISLGCAKNLVDTEVMLGHLSQAGWEFTRDPADADVIVVNTCGFIGPAREESIQAILEAAELKQTGRLRRLVVAGCLVQRHGEELRASLPEVDAFVDLDRLDRIVEAAVGGLAPELSGPSAGAPWSAATYLYDDRTPRRLATAGWTAYVKIAEGCDHTCAFCAIPSFRGRFRSREAESVLREARRLADGGVRELNLVAQDSSHYGRDLGLSDGLAQLLDALDRVDGLRWIRLHYLYPNTVTDRLIGSMARGRRIVDYVDLPLQHADPAVLRRMRRGGSAAQHLELLSRFRRAMPSAAVRTTLIVGFPGETEREFEHLLDFVREARFEHLGVFVYSHEPGTPAGAWDDDVPEATKRERRERLLACQQQIVFERHRRALGRRVEVLCEGTHPDTDWLLVGRTRHQAPEVDGLVLINDGTAAPGEFVDVELTDTAGYDVVGRVVGRA
jgi:ribosomal protein S12 methylthiotransferase